MNSDKLAQNGGQPAKSVPFTKTVRYGDAELEQLKEALAQGSLFYAHGKKVRQLEEAFSRWMGCERAIATSSGTASVHAALIAAGVSPGDEVIVPPITDAGTVIPVLFQGAIPVFADLDPETCLLYTSPSPRDGLLSRMPSSA